MSIQAERHLEEMRLNMAAWGRKPLLREIYAGFYTRICAHIDAAMPGRIVEIGSGIGNLKAHLPGAVSTDLFPNPWLDLACDGYEMPFKCGSLSHLVLFDVFHHLEAPGAFLVEARRVLVPGGRLILFEPYISLLSRPVYGLFHHEPLGMGDSVNLTEEFPRPRSYYAAQGNATRLFFRKEKAGWPEHWQLLAAEAFSCFHYLLSGGYSKPAFYPAWGLRAFRRMDLVLSRWPRIFGGRCMVVLRAC